MLKKAFTEYGKLRLSCYVHTLQLVILKALTEPDLQPAIDTAKRLVVKFHNQAAGQELKSVSGGKGVVMFIVTVTLILPILIYMNFN